MMSPGTYIARRRAAAGLSIEDVAAQVRAEPRIGDVDRIAWLRRIEADVAALSPDVYISLSYVFPISVYVLRQLIDLRSYGEDLVIAPAICRVCACSETDPCVDADTHQACAWAEDDLCTACAGKEAVQ